jgi:hypothetical protein
MSLKIRSGQILCKNVTDHVHTCSPPLYQYSLTVITMPMTMLMLMLMLMIKIMIMLMLMLMLMIMLMLMLMYNDETINNNDQTRHNMVHFISVDGR